MKTAMTIRERLLSNIKEEAHPRLPDPCWVWTLSLNSYGYGQAFWGGKNIAAHIRSYREFVGEIPQGMQVDHLCHRRDCINPAHLRAASRAVNAANRKGPTRSNKLGVRGVHETPEGTFRAQVWAGGRKVFQRSFKTIAEAEAAVIEARRIHLPGSVL